MDTTHSLLGKLMNQIKNLIERWEEDTQTYALTKEISAQLSLSDYARIRALTEIYPSRTETQIVTELLATALDLVEEALPYIPGKKVIAEDELGDPIYEDVGLTPRFEALTRKYSARLQEETD